MPQYGGSFAPPLGAEGLKGYRKLLGGASPPVRDAAAGLCDLAAAYARGDKRHGAGTPHPSGVGLIVPLAQGDVERLWDVTPWDHELAAAQQLFDALPAGPKGSAEKALRDACFHLLWYAKEIAAGRHPLTSDRL